MRIAQLDTPNRSTVLRLRRTQFSLSGTVPDSVALWNTTCSGLPPASAMEMSAGLRWPAGRASSRARRAVPSVQAVSAVNVRKVYASLVSWAMRTAGWLVVCGGGVSLVCFEGLGWKWEAGYDGGLTSVLGAVRAILEELGVLL